MARQRLTFFVLIIALGGLAGCSNWRRAERPAWRTHAEEACFARRMVALSPYVQPASHEIDGPSICGLTRPLKVTALQNGAVRFNSTQTLDCSMVAELDRWVAEVAQPAALARFGQNIVEINSMGSYNCRGMNNQMGARLSEHSFGNAIDLGGYRLADGREISYVRDWTRGDPQTQAFLRDLHGGACDHFTTVLSPGSNPFHYNHMHIDLAMHGMSSRGPRSICKPARQDTIAPPSKDDGLPETPEFEDDLDIAQAGGRGGAPMASSSYAGGGPAVAAAVPLSPVRRPPPGVPLAMPRSAYAPAPLAVQRSAAANAPLGAPKPLSRPKELGPVTLHAQNPTPPRRVMREDGGYDAEGAPSDFDLPARAR